MLELKDVRKTYRVGDIETKALDGVSVAFRQKEFVSGMHTAIIPSVLYSRVII